MSGIEAIKAVIFDFGGVLCFHPTDEKYGRIAALLGIETNRLYELFWENRIDYDSGKLDAPAYWGRLARKAGKPLDEALLNTLLDQEVHLWDNYDWRVLDWARHLREEGVRTAILSNLTPVLGAALRAEPDFVQRFDHVTFSYELGIVKPQAAIYHDAVRGVGVAPDEALFLDDKLENVQGAIAAGLHAEVYTTWEHFLERSAGRYGLPMLLQSP